MSSQKKKLFDFLKDAITAARSSSDPLYKAKLRFTHFEYTDEDELGLCLSNAISEPGMGIDGVSEFDVRLIITSYARIQGVERDDRYEPYEKSKAAILKVSELLLEDDGLGGRSCRTMVGQLVDDVDDQLSASQRHAVNNLYVILNWSGKEFPAPWGR
ncbi:MAG TPA: hypothetical protein VEF04_03030 [Blastocatellia bacterium]|nr:hypothetical protein [Blastocatellia bacterium]